MFTSIKQLFVLLLVTMEGMSGLRGAETLWPPVHEWAIPFINNNKAEHDTTALLHLSGTEQNITFIFQIHRPEDNLLDSENIENDDATPIAVMIQQKSTDESPDDLSGKIGTNLGI